MRLALLLCWVAPSLAASDFVERLLAGLGGFLREAGTYSPESGSLPDFRVDFTIGEVRAAQGFFRTNFRCREDGLQANMRPQKVSLLVPLELTNFEAGYTNCWIQVGGTTAQGNLTFREPARNSVQLRLEYSRTEPCQLKVLGAEVAALGGFGLAAGNLVPFQSAAMVLGGWLATSVEDSLQLFIRAKLEHIFNQTATNLLKSKGSLCSMLPI